jgi:hypothetical protein
MNFIPVNRPLLKGNEKNYVTQAIDSGWVSSDGPFVEEFEHKFSKKVNRKYGIAVANGTAALEIAIKALGISSGQEVIMPTFTIISCALSVLRNGAKPVFVDCFPDTWNLNTLTKLFLFDDWYGSFTSNQNFNLYLIYFPEFIFFNKSYLNTYFYVNSKSYISMYDHISVES